ncbi:MAG: hypothetical protein GX925_03685 [Clostridiales bacterium]|nr:hypothetical protein [Clostridiales bacterium]
MKKVFIIFTFIIVIACHNFIFASYNGKTTEQELYKQVKRIFCERARIWNNYLIGQYTSLAQLEEELETVVTNPLFRADMEMFEQMLSVPTSYEDISGVSVQDVHVIKNNFRGAVLEASILWEIEGYENNYKEEIEYIVEMKKDGENWLLSDYKINNRQ